MSTSNSFYYIVGPHSQYVYSTGNFTVTTANTGSSSLVVNYTASNVDVEDDDMRRSADLLDDSIFE